MLPLALCVGVSMGIGPALTSIRENLSASFRILRYETPCCQVLYHLSFRVFYVGQLIPCPALISQIKDDRGFEPYDAKVLTIQNVVGDLKGLPLENLSIITLLMRQRHMKDTDNEPVRKLTMAVDFFASLLQKVCVPC